MYVEKKYSLWFRAINGGKIRKFTWANIVNKAALRRICRIDTLIRNIDLPAKHDGLLCRFWFWFDFYYIGFRFLMFIIRFWFSLYNLKAKTKTGK